MLQRHGDADRSSPRTEATWMRCGEDHGDGGTLTPTFPMWESQFAAEDVAAVVTTHTPRSTGHGALPRCRGHGAGVGCRCRHHRALHVLHGERMLGTRRHLARNGCRYQARQYRPLGDACLVITCRRWSRQTVLQSAERCSGFMRWAAPWLSAPMQGAVPTKPHDVLPHAAHDLVGVWASSSGS